MKIIEKYSHLNGEEYLIVHHKNILDEIIEVIENVDVEKFRTKESKEKTMKGKMLYNPRALNKEFDRLFQQRDWKAVKYSYCVTTDRSIMNELITLPFKEQKEFLIQKGINFPIISYKQTDFVKDTIAVEVQFGKYSFVAYDLFVKHFYSTQVV